MIDQAVKSASEQAMKLLVGALVVAAVLGIVVGVLAGRGCSPKPLPPIETAIDAGPGDQVIASELDASVQADEQAIRQLELRNQRSLEQLNEQQQQDYAQVRRQGRHAVARWLSDYNRQLKTDAGTPQTP